MRRKIEMRKERNRKRARKPLFMAARNSFANIFAVPRRCGLRFAECVDLKGDTPSPDGSFIHTAFINETWLNRFPQTYTRYIAT